MAVKNPGDCYDILMETRDAISADYDDLITHFPLTCCQTTHCLTYFEIIPKSVICILHSLIIQPTSK